MKTVILMLDTIKGICISANYKKEIDYISSLIIKYTPNVKIYSFNEILDNILLLEKCDYIFTIGGDGSVAWVIGKFFEKYGSENLNKLKPFVPVIRPKSLGYLKQLDFEEKKFLKGYKKLISGKYSILNRNVLETNVDGKKYLAVNEINIGCAPHLGKFNIYLEDGGKYHLITKTMADAALLVTPIGSTGWGLSYSGQIVLAEDTIELVFAGGIHSSANFNLPSRKVKIKVELKNSSIIPETIHGYELARKRDNLIEDREPGDTLKLIFGTRVIIDGKLIAFGVDCLEIDPSNTVPFVFLHKETTMDKARKLTKQQSVK